MSEQERLLREALEAAEWYREDGHQPPQCTVCDGWGDVDGHTPECIVGRALGRTPGKGDPMLIAEAKAQDKFMRNFLSATKEAER